MRLLVGLGLFLCVFVLACQASRVLLEERQVLKLPLGYRLSAASKSEGRTSLTFALKLRNTEALTAKLYAVSTPHSPFYGQYLDQDAVVELTSPRVDDVLRLVKWIDSVAADAVVYADDVESARRSGFLRVSVSVGDAERLLGVTLSRFVHAKTGEGFWRALHGRYSLPADVAALVDFVGGVHRLPRRGREQRPTASRALPVGNSPLIVSVYPSSHEFVTLFFPRCADGSLLTSTASPCVSGFRQTVQYGTLQGVADTTTWPLSGHPSSRGAVCQPCGHFAGRQLQACAAVLQSYGVSGLDAVFCQSPALRSYPNYVRLETALVQEFAGGNGSSAPGHYTGNLYLGEFMSPALLRQRYGVPDGLYGAAGAANSMSVAEFLGQYYAPADLELFFRLNGIVGPVPVELIGPNNASNPGGEASLDIQYIMGIAPNVSTVFWSLGQLHDGQEPFLDWIVDVLNSPSPPLVHSVSYADDEDSLSLEYMLRVDYEFQKAGARGLSIFFAAGDNGVASSDPDSPGCPGHFVPSFPSSSPHITAVSGTQFSTQWSPLCLSTGDSDTLSYQCDRVEEIASSTLTGSRISTGGGFSNVFPRPAYQNAAVAAYLHDYVPRNIPAGWYNASGRCYGDISSSARNYPTVIGNDVDSVDGTSAATPTIAALVALINDRLLLQGKSPVGFINPALYAMPKTHFFDVVLGDNRCPEELSACCPYGLTASPLYDPLSGRGTPHFAELLNYFDALQK